MPFGYRHAVSGRNVFRLLHCSRLDRSALRRLAVKSVVDIVSTTDGSVTWFDIFEATPRRSLRGSLSW